MKKNIISILLILFVPVIAYMALSKSVEKTTQAIAESVNKPQIIKFTSAMCMDCQKMNKIMQEIFPKYENKITLTEVHVQDGSSFSNSEIKKYKVTLVPTIILIDSNGKQVKRIEGAIEKNEMEKCLKGLN